MVSLHPKDYFDLSAPAVAGLFEGVDLVWDVLPRLAGLVAEMAGDGCTIKGTVMPGATVADSHVYIGEGAVVEPGAYVQGPAYIGPGAVIRHGAYVRANVLMLERSVLGHASEAKNALLLPGAGAPHFAYVGDSILGHRVNLGAGTKLSNLTLVNAGAGGGKKKAIKVRAGDTLLDTGLTKLGAILGDGVSVGCNAVLNPGTVVGPEAVIYPNTTLVNGVYPARAIVKLRQEQVIATLR